MNNPTVFITGAASGIGLAAAKLFSSQGYYVGLYDIDEKGLIELNNELGQKNSCYSICDISDENSVKLAFLHFSKNTNNRLDVLLANAGIILQGKFEDFSAEQYKKLININAFGTTNTILQALHMLKTTKNSALVITSSSSGMFGIPTFAAYSSTKAYLKSLAESLATEFKPYKIKVANVMPLFVKTKMMNDIDSKHKANLTPEQIAKVIFKAATKSKKRHHLVGANLRAFDLLRRLLPTKAFERFIAWYLKV